MKTLVRKCQLFEHFWVNWNKGSFVIFWSFQNFFRAIYSSLIVVVFLGLPLFVVLLLYVLCKLCGPLICHHCNIKLWRLSISFCSIIFGFPKLIVCVEESQKRHHDILKTPTKFLLQTQIKIDILVSVMKWKHLIIQSLKKVFWTEKSLNS